MREASRRVGLEVVRLGERFADHYGVARTSPAPKLHAALACIITAPEIVRLIGRPTPVAGGGAPWPDEEAPSWIRLDEAGTMPMLRLGFRGALIRTPFHREVDNRGRVIAVEVTESERLYSFEALKEAAEAARTALRAAGFMLSTYVRVEQAHGGQSALAAIGLRSLSPARARGPTMAR